MSGRAKRVLVYAAALLLAPLAAMPFERGTREFVVGLAAWGGAVALASLYVARGELRHKARGLLGAKLLASSLITLACGAATLAGSVIYLCLF